MQQDKNRKSEAQKIFEEADNAGRFAGEDNDAKSARQNATENIKQEAGSNRGNENRNDNESGLDLTNDNSGEAQNVNSGRGKGNDLAGNNKDMDHARDKAMQGIKEGRDTGSSGNTDMNRGNPDQKGGRH